MGSERSSSTVTVEPATPAVRVDVFGGPRVSVGHEVIPLSGARVQRLIACLAVADRPVRMERPIGVVWPDGEEPPSAERTVQSLVSRLRARLGAAVVRRGPDGYRLVGQVNDLARFELGVGRAAEAGDGGGAARTLAEADGALALWTGDPFGSFGLEPWFLPITTRLVERRLQALALRVEALRDLGRLAEAVVAARSLVGEDPLRERPQVLLAEVLGRAGRPVEALRSLHAYRDLLVEETGLDPGLAVRELEARIVAGAHPEPSAERSGTARREVLGRDREVAEVGALLGGAQLVTIVGPGGIGKTTVARAALDAMQHGAVESTVAIELAFVTADGVAGEVAQALGVARRPAVSWLGSLQAALTDRSVLIVLDNCDHVIEATRELVGALVPACRRVLVLATCRQALTLPDERVVVLGGLEAEGIDSPAVRLFVDRARATAGVDAVTDRELSVVEEIVKGLDAIPLAIELAAAWARTMTPVDLRAQLDDVLPVLRNPALAVERHRTMEATIAWTYEALSAQEAAAFRRLAVFRGGFDVAGAEAVWAMTGGEGFAMLDRLVAKCLIARTRRPDGAGRFSMLEPLRQYADRRLAEAGELDETLDRYVAHLAHRADRSVNQRAVVGDLDLLELLTVDWSNLVAAARCAAGKGDLDAAARLALAGDLGMFQYRFELHDLAEWLVDLPAMAEHPLLADLLLLASIGAIQRGRADDSSRFFARAEAAHLDVDQSVLVAVKRASDAWLLHGDPEACARAYEAMEVGSIAADFGRYFIGAAARRELDFEAGQDLLRQGIAWARERRLRIFETAFLEQYAQGYVLAPDRSAAAGAVIAEEARGMAAAMGLGFFEQQATLHLGRAALRGVNGYGDPATLIARALRAALDADAVANQWFALPVAAQLLAGSGHPVDAALVALCAHLNPFGGSFRLRDALLAATTERDLTAASDLALTIDCTETLSRRILALLESVSSGHRRSGSPPGGPAPA